MSVLVPCPSCARHVRASESSCPFCGDGLPSDLASRAVPPANRRLSRAAAFTFATTLAVAGSMGSAACGGEVVGGPDDHGGVVTEYGAPNVDDGGSGQAMYGLANPDGGESSDGGFARDGGHRHDDGGIAPMYGVANPDAGPADDGGGVAAYGLPGH